MFWHAWIKCSLKLNNAISTTVLWNTANRYSFDVCPEVCPEQNPNSSEGQEIQYSNTAIRMLVFLEDLKGKLLCLELGLRG